MALERKASLGVGLASAGLVFALYQQGLPSVADVRAVNSENRHINGSEKTVRWVAAGLVLAIAAIAQDATVFILGGSMVVAESWIYRHANMVDPTVGLAVMPSSRTTVHAADAGGVTAGYAAS